MEPEEAARHLHAALFDPSAKVVVFDGARSAFKPAASSGITKESTMVMFIVGPAASGKTSLALDLARQMGEADPERTTIGAGFPYFPMDRARVRIVDNVKDARAFNSGEFRACVEFTDLLIVTTTTEPSEESLSKLPRVYVVRTQPRPDWWRTDAAGGR